jgi:hypothetical protein
MCFAPAWRSFTHLAATWSQGLRALRLGELDLGDCAARAQGPPLRLASPENAT